MSVLDVKDLHKHYGDLKAVNGVSFSVQKGICFGLLGPNGAGKSTTIEVVEGLKPATSGEIFFQGKPRASDYKQKIGIQFQTSALQDHMTTIEALYTFSRLYDKTRSVDELIELCNLEPFLSQDHRRLSGGQRQRLLLAIALINDPELIFLDEPTTGLDPQARQNFWDLVNSIKAKGKTVILTTHYMDEAFTLCDEIIIIDKGQIIAEGPPQNLLGEHFKGTKIRLPVEVENLMPSGIEYVNRKGYLEFSTTDLKKTMEHLISSQVPFDQLVVEQHTLEDLFIALTGKGLRS